MNNPNNFFSNYNKDNNYNTDTNFLSNNNFLPNNISDYTINNKLLFDNDTNNIRNDDYIKYDNLLLNDGTDKQEMANSGYNCITKCSNDPNCQGVNIIMNNVKNNIHEDGYNYQNIPPVTCEYVNNICYSNTKSENDNSIFYAKKNLHLENNVPHLLKNNNICLSVKNNNLVGNSNCNDTTNLTPVFFEKGFIKVGTEGDNCINVHNGNLNLSKCNSFLPNGKFVYENVYNTLRPYSDTTQCISTYGDKNQNYFYITPFEQSSDKCNITFENYHAGIQDDNIESFQNTDYSTDMTYYIIYMTLLCMIAFLVIISSK